MLEPHAHAAPQVSCGADANGDWRIELHGEIDLNTDPLLDATLATVTDAAPGEILVDLTDVTFLASTGLGFLAQLRNHVAPAGHTVTLHAPHHAVRRALTLIGFDQHFRITAP